MHLADFSIELEIIQNNEEIKKDNNFIKICGILILASAVIFLIVMTIIIFLSIFLPAYFF